MGLFVDAEYCARMENDHHACTDALLNGTTQLAFSKRRKENKYLICDFG